mmetsp:Transcript_33063/g.86513  ORF Transcript_33063/g.86513 Transcript_33063/m.86513 type:complete len:342 (-) Transcript_33063:239-1264(-)
MPNGDPDAGSTGVVQSLLRYRRSNGIAVLLGTQSPGDVNQAILNNVRLRFIGEGIAGKAKMCAPLFTGTGTMRAADVPPPVEKGADGVPQFIFDYGVPTKRETAAELKEREKKAWELFEATHRERVEKECSSKQPPITKKPEITKELKAQWEQCDKAPYLSQAQEELAGKDGGGDDEGADDEPMGQDDASEEAVGEKYAKNQKVSFCGPLMTVHEDSGLWTTADCFTTPSSKLRKAIDFQVEEEDEEDEEDEGEGAAPAAGAKRKSIGGKPREPKEKNFTAERLWSKGNPMGTFEELSPEDKDAEAQKAANNYQNAKKRYDKRLQKWTEEQDQGQAKKTKQ